MKAYIAARFNQKDQTLDIARKLKDRGYDFISDWTSHKSIKPYEQNSEMAQQYAIEDVDGTRNTDLFILISDEAGTGMYVELGAAIASNLMSGKPKIYVIGNQLDRSMFYFHPTVNRRNTIEDVLKEI